ncbi:MAG: uroporphyrinogen decarboxylase family protein [Armatimonadota bacterium]
MNDMTSHERFTRMFEHKEADRVPIIDGPWGATLERWAKEGLPAGVDFVDFFDLDHVVGIGLDNSPRYESKVLEETDDYAVYTTPWGATLKNWKHIASTPEFIDFIIKDRESWEKAKERMTPTEDRIPWEHLKSHYKTWREKGYWIQIGFWFGFDVTHSWTVGTERLLMALIEDPEWCIDMFNHFLDMDIALADAMLDAGYTFDSIMWPDDMGYKYNQFFSLKTYRELLKPVHKRAIEWAHSRGIKAHLHSCGNINPFIPELIEIGLDALNPLEVKAGMNPVELKQKYGDKLVFHGGIDAVLWDDFDALETQMRRVVPVMKESGGYIFSSDHSVPSSVSLDNFRRITDLAKELGSYS